MRTFIYVDGFNLYYGSLKGTQHKWLDLQALFRRVLQPHHDVRRIKYFTARVSARGSDANAPIRQDAYLAALMRHTPCLEVIEGRFSATTVKMKLVSPLGGQQFALVHKTEEKGSDVNLAIHLLNDAWRNEFDSAVVVSNDSDLAEALRLVKQDHRKQLIHLVPGPPKVRRPNNDLKRWCAASFNLKPEDLAACQLPDPIPGTNLRKPADW